MSTRVFVDSPCVAGALVTIAPEEARHLALVLRAKPGDAVTLVSEGEAWDARLVEVRREKVTAQIVDRSAGGELPVPLIVLQALPKGNKMDEVVEKVTELGAARIVPIRCERSYAGHSPAKLERWRRIARAAAAQSGRLIVPAVDETMDFAVALERCAGEAHMLVAWEEATPGSLASALERAAPDRALGIVIGPEGSFTSDELAIADRIGCHRVALGPTTLRTETAAAAAIAAVAALRTWW